MGKTHTIYTLQFPCNVPASGCQDNDYSGPPSCGCADQLKSDAPADSCKNCVIMGNLPPTYATITFDHSGVIFEIHMCIVACFVFCRLSVCAGQQCIEGAHFQWEW